MVGSEIVLERFGYKEPSYFSRTNARWPLSFVYSSEY